MVIRKNVEQCFINYDETKINHTDGKLSHCIYYLIQNSQAVKKVCGPQKGYGEKRCEIQSGGQEMAVMVG